MLGLFVKTTTNKGWTSHLLVGLQVVFLVLCCVPIGWQNTGSGWFLFFCAAGAILGVCVLYYNRPKNFGVYPEIKIGAQLITNGPYSYIRHPMYTALMTMMVGVAGYNGHWVNYMAAMGIIAVVVIKAFREERLLPQVFPEYEAYQARTSRFLPYFI